MNHKIEFHAGGGIFSYMGILFENLLKWDNNGDINDKDTIYVDSRNDVNKTVLSQIGFNYFDYLLDQNPAISNTLKTTEIHPVYLHEFEDRKDSYKELSRKYITVNKKLSDLVNKFIESNFSDGKTLGIHVRMTDMNHHHPYLGQVSNQHYFDNIDLILKENDIDKIFVASDNFESISLIREKYGDMVINYETTYRVDKSNDDSLDFIINEWIKKPEFFEDSFIDSLLLSNCNISLGRTSLFNWGSQSFHWSKIEKYYHIAGDESNIKDPNADK